MKPIHSLVLFTTLSHIVQVGSRLAVMLYGVHLGASPATVGVLSALYSLVSIFTSMPVGLWLDRAGARAPLLISAVMVIVGAAVGFLFPNLAALFVVATLIGTFYNFTYLAQQRVAGQYGGPEDRVSNFSMVALGQSVASTAGPILTGYVIEHFGYAEVFMAFTAIAVLPLAAILMGGIVIPAPEARPPRGAAKRTGTLALLRSDRPLRRMYVLAVVASSTWSIVTFLLPLYGTQIGLSPVTIGLILGSFAMATVAIRIALPWLSRRLKPWRLLLGALLVSAAALTPIPFFSGVWMLGTLAALIGMGLGLCGPVSQAILYDISPPGRVGELLGLRATLLNVSHGGMPMISGVLGTAIGVGPVFWIVAGALFACGWYIRKE